MVSTGIYGKIIYEKLKSPEMTHPSEDGLADSVPTVPVVPGAAGDEAAAAEAAGAPP